MISVTLPDGSCREFSQALSIHQIAESIGSGLAKAALAGKVGDRLVDTSFIIEQDAELAIITAKDPEGLEVIRHSTAHLLAMAVKQLFPEAQVTIGPVIDDGFYYDFAFERPFTPEDIKQIEERMYALAKENTAVTREEITREDAIGLFAKMGEDYKVEIIRDIPEGQVLSFYRQGDFIDLCRGPHVPFLGALKAFKLTKLAGAYWRGDSNNEMLQRIYGTAWPDKKQLKAYLHRIEEAEKRDHRKIAKALDLFHFQEEAPGMVFWHDKGWQIFRTLEAHIREKLTRYDYQEIKTPQIVDKVLWEKSGHMAKYSDDMFLTNSENREYAIKPMSCPCHVQVFNQGLKSYRDLPLRMAEFGCCHRNEASGALHGLMRVRNFTQDDAHVFCTEDQMQAELITLIDLVFETYSDFGFNDVAVHLSTRPDNRIGSDEIWDKAEDALIKALDAKGLPWIEYPGEGAFYGPKIDFHLKDCLERVWQCGTVQIDFSMPDRLGAHYIAEDGSRQVPVMIHRAILGSVERFIGILIEQFAGKLPLWLAPQQAVVMNITDAQQDFAQKITEILKNHGIRTISDLRNEKIGFKIREHTISKVPYLLVVGDREMESDSVAVRTQSGEDLGSMSVKDLLSQLQSEIERRGS